MKTLTLAQAKKQGFKTLQQATGLTPAQIISKVKAEAKHQYGCLYGEIKHQVGRNSVKVFITDNDNFANGKKNGYGAGVYMAIYTPIQGQIHIKL